MANCAIRFVRYLDRRNRGNPRKWWCRVGIATGSVVGSVVGVQKYVYDIFGPAVNLASRLQEFAEPMGIVVPGAMKDALVEEFTLADHRQHQIRGIGEMRLFGLASTIERERAPRFS